MAWSCMATSKDSACFTTASRSFSTSALARMSVCSELLCRPRTSWSLTLPGIRSWSQFGHVNSQSRADDLSRTTKSFTGSFSDCTRLLKANLWTDGLDCFVTIFSRRLRISVSDSLKKSRVGLLIMARYFARLRRSCCISAPVFGCQGSPLAF